MNVIKSAWINPDVCAEGLENGDIRLTCSNRTPLFSLEEFQSLIRFKTSFAVELASRQNHSLPELKPIDTVLVPALKP